MARSKPRVVDVTNALSRDDYKETLTKIAQAGLCPFCEQNLAKHHPKPIVAKNASWLATPSNWPYRGAKRHFLLIARPHLERADKLTREQWIDLHKLLIKLVRSYKLRGTSLVMRSGDTAYTGASVSHLHAHLITGRRRRNPKDEIVAPIGYF
ncbi:MAG: HIT domain-containing protein [Patescibacteria group bacterium]|nr:HIT domain-containing protein [Patescibacteria group bacterium]MDE1944470.1 HIT domain-containing protein [Patescibacteria group bacterium]MDE1944771.1 HIT domain-containing protein [Patescibacteria group bacterium]MDE2057224.1 HIT domain-containing protein [Patescibacteria group bacterium]